ncbi:MAG: hypothetical protein WCV82_04470 [Candidatus Paceibacterota bacterium]
MSREFAENGELTRVFGIGFGPFPTGESVRFGLEIGIMGILFGPPVRLDTAIAQEPAPYPKDAAANIEEALVVLHEIVGGH